MFGDVEVKDTAPVVGEHEEYEQDAKSNGAGRRIYPRFRRINQITERPVSRRYGNRIRALAGNTSTMGRFLQFLVDPEKWPKKAIAP